MYGITYDIDERALEEKASISQSEAEAQIESALSSIGYERFKSDIFVCPNPNGPEIVIVHDTITTLNGIPWAKDAVKNLVAFRIEDWGDITNCLK